MKISKYLILSSMIAGLSISVYTAEALITDDDKGYEDPNGAAPVMRQPNIEQRLIDKAASTKKLTISMPNAVQQVSISVSVNSKSFGEGVNIGSLNLSAKNKSGTFSIPAQENFMTYIHGHCSPPPAMACEGPRREPKTLPVSSIHINVPLDKYNYNDYYIDYSGISSSKENNLIIDIQNGKATVTLNGKTIKRSGWGHKYQALTPQQTLEHSVTSLELQIRQQLNGNFKLLNNVVQAQLDYQSGPAVSEQTERQELPAKTLDSLKFKITQLQKMLASGQAINKSLNQQYQYYQEPSAAL